VDRPDESTPKSCSIRTHAGGWQCSIAQASTAVTATYI
jgi:hypothetical protein